MKEKNKRKVLAIVRSYWKDSEIPRIPYKEFKEVHDLLVKTNMDGIAHLVFKNKKIPLTIKHSLEKGYEAIRSIDTYHEKVLLKLQQISCSSILIKEAQFKINKKYEKGTRYSCDIDIFTSEDPLLFDEELRKKGFFLEGIDYWRKKSFVKDAFAINENVLIAPKIYEEQKKELKDKKDITFKTKIEERVNELENAKKRIKQLQKNIKNNYFHKTGGMLDVHFKFFPEKEHFRIKKEQIQFEKIRNKLYAIKAEDNIIISACHFLRNLYKHKQKKGYQGFLKYLNDIHFILQTKKINWKRVEQLAAITNSSSQTYYYLKLGKQYLGCDVPSKTLKQLKKQGSKIQNNILKRINPYNILFNERDNWAIIYSKCYLEEGILFTLIDYFHNVIAHVKKWKK